MNIIMSSLQSLKFYHFYHFNHDYEKKLLIKNQIFHKNHKQKLQCSLILDRIFRFLQLLCQNDNHYLKRYIFNQTNSQNKIKYMSINFIEIAIDLLNEIVEIISFNIKNNLMQVEQFKDYLFDIPIFIMDFLIEVCQYPTIENQLYICKTDFFDIIKKIKLIKETNTELYLKGHQQFFYIEKKIVLLCRSLLQQRNPSIIEILQKKIDEDAIFFLIKDSLVYKTEENSQVQDKLQEYKQSIVDLLIINKALNKNVIDKFDDESQKIFLLKLKHMIRQIQVDFKGQLTQIYFSYLPIFDRLSESTKDFILDKTYTFNSRSQKLRHFITSRSIIYQDIKHRTTKNSITINQNSLNFIFYLSIFLCLVCLGMQLMFYSVNKSGITLDYIQTQQMKYIKNLQFLFTVIYVVLWGINIRSITEEKMKSKLVIEQRQNEEMQQEQIEQPIKTSYFSSKVTETKYYYRLLKEIYFIQSTSFEAVLLLFISFFSCFFELRLYSLVIMFVFSKVQLLSSILTAIRMTIGKLFAVCLLAIFFSFVFGYLSLNNYIGAIFENQSIDIEIQQIQTYCSTILTCIESLYIQRIIGETPSRQQQSNHYGRFVSDSIHWGFFDILLSNIIAAIIIDKFAELRNIRQKINNQKKNRCFVCSIDKSGIERRNQSFEFHVNKKHNVWDYYFYLYSLENLKPNTEYTGLQYWITKQVQNNHIDWIPMDDPMKQGYNEKKINELYEGFKKRLMNQLKIKNND